MSKPKPPPGINYTHRASYTYQERLIGLFVLTSLGVLLAVLLASDRTREFFENTFVIHGHLSSAQGVEPGTQVRVSGIGVGKVAAVAIEEDNRVVVTMRISETVGQRLHADASGELGGLSVLGRSSIEIDPGSPDAPPLPPEAHIKILEAPSVNEVIAKVTPVLGTLEGTIEDISAIVAAVKPEQVGATVTDLSEAITALKELLREVQAGRGTLGALVADETMAQDTRAAVATLGPALETARGALAAAEARLQELQPVVADAAKVGSSAREAAAPLPELVRDVRLAVNQANLALATLNTEFQQLPDLVTRMKLLLDQANSTLEGAQRIWPLSSVTGGGSESTLIEAQPLND